MTDLKEEEEELILRSISRVSTKTPKQSARSRYVRTPASKLHSQRKSNLSSLSQGVLITQLADSDSDSDYDTDLDEDEPKPPSPEKVIYEKVCKDVGVTPISYYYRHMKNKDFTLRYRYPGGKGSRALSIPMQLNKQIEKLDLTDNCLGPGGTRCFTAMLTENTNITELNLSFNNIGRRGAIFLRDELVENTILKKVDISGNGFGDKEAHYFADIIKGNHYITELNLSHNDFCSEGAILLGPAIAHNGYIEYLDLSWNHIRLKGAEIIADSLKTNNVLKVLNLSNNGFANQGAIAIGESLQMNNTLEDLDLSNNRIAPGGAIVFSQHLHRNTGLKILKMGINPILFTGAVAIIKAIATSAKNTVYRLDLTKVTVHQEFMDWVADLQLRRHFEVKVGFLSRAKETKGMWREKVNMMNPLLVLCIFMREQGLRILDLFKNMDKDHNYSLTRDEFKTGLQSVQFPLTEGQLDELMEILDTDKNGEVDIAEILAINRKHANVKMKANKLVAAEKERKRLERARAKLPKLKSNNNLVVIESTFDDDNEDTMWDTLEVMQRY
ncbi:unnamed protein product [Owenia fusiformis]|uniref:Uncharacterized protein n=1 Tax=Owenia fusiformis TaxID=6347 RepID=A0A8J1XWW5_OWEFU|nr:unnamed protein product [Owenia fusiformis]